MKNYFTDTLLYQEANKVSKESLPGDDDSGNEADLESEEDMPATFSFEPIVACFNNSQCNDPIGDDADEWVINENATFDYLRVSNYLNLSTIALYICLCLY